MDRPSDSNREGPTPPSGDTNHAIASTEAEHREQQQQQQEQQEQQQQQQPSEAPLNTGQQQQQQPSEAPLNTGQQQQQQQPSEAPLNTGQQQQQQPSEAPLNTGQQQQQQQQQQEGTGASIRGETPVAHHSDPLQDPGTNGVSPPLASNVQQLQEHPPQSQEGATGQGHHQDTSRGQNIAGINNELHHQEEEGEEAPPPLMRTPRGGRGGGGQERGDPAADLQLVAAPTDDSWESLGREAARRMATEDGYGEVHGAHPQVQEEEEEPLVKCLVCDACAAPLCADEDILRERANIWSTAVYAYELEVFEKDAWCYSATNPSAHRFDVVRIHAQVAGKCIRCSTAGGRGRGSGFSAEHSWFPSYSWCMCYCRCCGKHLGWGFASDEEIEERKEAITALHEKEKQKKAKKSDSVVSKEEGEGVTQEVGDEAKRATSSSEEPVQNREQAAVPAAAAAAESEGTAPIVKENEKEEEEERNTGKRHREDSESHPSPDAQSATHNNTASIHNNNRGDVRESTDSTGGTHGDGEGSAAEVVVLHPDQEEEEEREERDRSSAHNNNNNNNDDDAGSDSQWETESSSTDTSAGANGSGGNLHREQGNDGGQPEENESLSSGEEQGGGEEELSDMEESIPKVEIKFIGLILTYTVQREFKHSEFQRRMAHMDEEERAQREYIHVARRIYPMLQSMRNQLRANQLGMLLYQMQLFPDMRRNIHDLFRTVRETLTGEHLEDRLRDLTDEHQRLVIRTQGGEGEGEAAPQREERNSSSSSSFVSSENTQSQHGSEADETHGQTSSAEPRRQL